MFATGECHAGDPPRLAETRPIALALAEGRMPSLVRLTALVDPLRLAETRPIAFALAEGRMPSLVRPDHAGGDAASEIPHDGDIVMV